MCGVLNEKTNELFIICMRNICLFKCLIVNIKKKDILKKDNYK